MKASELRKKTMEELQQELTALLREEFNLRIGKGLDEVKAKPQARKEVRRNIARIKTILREGVKKS
ncbi:MAG: 50S ribosomal protein L29 [Gammaproteobacteria bacterium]